MSIIDRKRRNTMKAKTEAKKQDESKVVKDWNKNNPVDTPVCYFVEPFGKMIRTFPSSKAWTENGYDLIMLEEIKEPVMLSKVSKDGTRLPRGIVKKYTKGDNVMEIPCLTPPCLLSKIIDDVGTGAIIKNTETNRKAIIIDFVEQGIPMVCIYCGDEDENKEPQFDENDYKIQKLSNLKEWIVLTLGEDNLLLVDKQMKDILRVTNC